MSNTNRTVRKILGITIIGMTLGIATRSDASDCETVSGTFQATLDGGLDCLSPVHICTNGTLGGDLSATYHFEVDTLTPDTKNPALSDFTGHTVMTVQRNSGPAYIYSHDAGTLTFLSPTQAALVNGIGIYDGTGTYEGATGFLLASGTVDFVTGVSAGPWSGTLCTDEDD